MQAMLPEGFPFSQFNYTYILVWVMWCQGGGPGRGRHQWVGAQPHTQGLVERTDRRDQAGAPGVNTETSCCNDNKINTEGFL